jgi:hypothetical protein
MAHNLRSILVYWVVAAWITLHLVLIFGTRADYTIIVLTFVLFFVVYLWLSKGGRW